MSAMKLKEARVLTHRDVAESYRELTLECPAVAAAVKPGQFVHLRVPRLDGSVLRRPFSIFKADRTSLSILYKLIGKGTNTLALAQPGDAISLLGPLGNGFPKPARNATPVLVGGGFGVAPLYLMASRLKRPGVLFVGGRTAKDILCERDFKALKWQVFITTEDGSRGEEGRVTDAFDAWRAHNPQHRLELFACGPDGMLKAVGERAIRHDARGWLSLDRHMGCAVGACLACVHKMRQPDGTVVWKRICREGPVFEAREIVWD